MPAVTVDESPNGSPIAATGRCLMIAVEWMFTTDGRARLTSCTNEVGAPGIGTTVVGDGGAGGGSDWLSARRQEARSSARTIDSALLRSDILHPQIEEQVLQQLRLLFGKVTPGLFLQHAQDVDGLLGQLEILRRLGPVGVLDLAQVHQRGGGQAHHERSEIDLGERVAHFPLGISTVSTPSVSLIVRRDGSTPAGSATWHWTS